MNNFFIETDRLLITEVDKTMAQSLHENSLDVDNRKFDPDEVYETIEDAKKIIKSILEWYKQERSPLVYPIILKSGDNIGYVQAIPLGKLSWEIGYHIAKKYTGNGYAAEAVKAFLPVIIEKLNIDIMFGIILRENIASRRVIEKCGFVLEYSGIGLYQGQHRNICKYSYKLQNATPLNQK